MKYFNDIADIKQAKLLYRKLAKQLHPDAGGTAHEFQNMQNEYKCVLQNLQQNPGIVSNPSSAPSPENELLSELGKLTKVLIKKQVPQNYLRQKIKTTDSPLTKGLFGDIVDLLDSIK